MNSLINKITKLAMIPILAVGLNGCGKENQKVSKFEGKFYVEFYDPTGLVYTDFEKDGSLDIFYDNKKYPNIIATQLVDNDYITKNDPSKRINRKGNQAKDLQKKFEEIKKEYQKQDKKWQT